MLGRVLKEVKLPFPDDFFPEMAVAPQLADDFHDTAMRLLHETLEAELPMTRFHPSQQSDNWKLIGDRNGLQLYRERGFAKGNAIKVNVLGQLTGTLEDVLLGLYATTNNALKTQRAIMHSDYLDAAVLHVLEEDPYSEDDTGFSYQFSGLKWMACAPSGKLVHKRDMCWHEELSRTRDANGDEVAYLIMQSVRVDECPPFEQQGLKRSTAAVCYIFRPLPNNLVGVYMKGQHSLGGKARTWSSDSVMADMWLGMASAMECAKAKRLSKLVSGKELFVASAPGKTCDICDSKLKMLKTNQHCKICGKNVCDRCRMTKLIYPSRRTGNFPCSYFFCKPCLSDAKEKLYGRANARVSYHSEDSEAVSGSGSSGSRRYIRAPSTGRQGLSMMSSSSDPTQRSRAPSNDVVGSSTMPNLYSNRAVHPGSPRSSSSTNYSSARGTVSSDSSVSYYGAGSMNPSLGRPNDSMSSSTGSMNGLGYQATVGRPTGRSVENRAAVAAAAVGPPRVMRTGSDSLPRNGAGGRRPPPPAPSQNQTNSRMGYGQTQYNASAGRNLPIAGYGSSGAGSQSMDSTFDVPMGESYRRYSDESDGSELSSESELSSDESSDEEAVEATRQVITSRPQGHQRQSINIYDADSDGVIEIPRDSEMEVRPEPEPVDVFQQDQLKYINSFRSDGSSTRGGTPGSASGGGSASSGGQGDLMERLKQINMAAEATYLMAKYNANIHDNGPK